MMRLVVLLIAAAAFAVAQEAGSAAAPAAAAPAAAAPASDSGSKLLEEIAEVQAEVAAAAAAAKATSTALASTHEEVVRAAAADKASDAALLRAVEQTQQSVTKTTGELSASLNAVDSVQRQLLGEFNAQKVALKGVTDSVSGASASLTSIASKQADDAKANTELAAQLKRVLTALDAVSESVNKKPAAPAVPAGPTKEQEAAQAAQRKADGERMDSLHALQRDTNSKLDAIEAAIKRLTDAVETAHRDAVEGRSIAARLKAFAADAKNAVVSCWACTTDFIVSRSHTIRPLIADWIASLHLQNRAIAFYEWSGQSATYWSQRAIAEGHTRADQLAELVKANGFPPQHASLFAMSLVLTASLIVAIVALWILSKTILPLTRAGLSAVAWTLGLIVLAIRGLLCCRLCRRRSAATADAAAGAKKSKKSKKKKSPGAAGATPNAADDEEPPSEDEVIPPANTRK